MQENQKQYEDEIDLRELFKTIWAKKVFITIFTFAITILAAVYAYTKTPTYEVKSFVEIGYINKEQLENISALEQKIKVIFDIENPIFDYEKFEKMGG